MIHFSNPRQIVALYLHLRRDEAHTNVELLSVQRELSQELCRYLSIEQFENLPALYEGGYPFNEIPLREEAI
ncbi:MAG: hypothetical protein ACR2PY_07550 [Salinispira sp.]